MSNEEQAKRDVYHRIDSESRIDGSHGWIQWKGTNVCMDVHCECGQMSHIDDEFVYSLRCPHCGRVYGVSPYVRLVLLTPEDSASYAEPKDAAP